MDGNSAFALAFISFAIFGPLVIMFLEYGLDPIAEKIVKYVDRLNKRDGS